MSNTHRRARTLRTTVARPKAQGRQARPAGQAAVAPIVPAVEPVEPGQTTPAAPLNTDGFRDTLEQVLGSDAAAGTPAAGTDAEGDVGSAEPPALAPARVETDTAADDRVAAALTGRTAGPDRGWPLVDTLGSGEKLTRFEAELLGRRPSDDPELAQVRGDLAAVLYGEVGAAAPRQGDTEVIPATGADETAQPPRDPDDVVAPAIPGKFSVHPIPAPCPPPPAPVPTTPELLHRIYGATWPKAAAQIRAEIDRFGPGRIASIYHTPLQPPSEDGPVPPVVANAVQLGFARAALVWDGSRYVGGEPRRDRMHPAALMHALSLHISPAAQKTHADYLAALFPADEANPDRTVPADEIEAARL